MAIVTAELSLDGLMMNGRLFQSPVQPLEYTTVLGQTARIIEPSPPAPYGHRNNQIHLFDALGLYLIEHHSTRNVDAVVFVLWLDEATFKPEREFSGDLTIGGVRIYPGMTPREFAACTIAFEGPILGHWNAQGGGISIGLSANKVRMPNGRRGKRLRFVDVSFCYS